IARSGQWKQAIGIASRLEKVNPAGFLPWEVGMHKKLGNTNEFLAARERLLNAAKPDSEGYELAAAVDCATLAPLSGPLLETATQLANRLTDLADDAATLSAYRITQALLLYRKGDHAGALATLNSVTWSNEIEDARPIAHAIGALAQYQLQNLATAKAE